MGTQTIIGSGTLDSNTFTRDGYTFAGWNTAADGSGTRYADNDTYTAPGGDTSITLYAQWFRGPTIQDFTASMCAEQASSSPVQVIDKRDGEVYSVQQLADGNCWLLENLRLDPTGVSLAALKGNTNASDQILTYFKDGGGSSPYPATGVIAKTADGGSWANSYNVPYVVTSGTENGGWDKNTVIAANGSSPAGKVGVYYNYCAATAGSYCYASGAGTSDASSDICPAGWQLPLGSTAAGSYYYLYNTSYSADVANFQTALSTPVSGYYYSSQATQNTYGRFWSRTVYGATGSSMYILRVSPTAASRTNQGRNYGGSVRCVAK